MAASAFAAKGRQQLRSLGWKLQEGKTYTAWVVTEQKEDLHVEVRFDVKQGRKLYFHVNVTHTNFGFVDGTKRPIISWAVPDTLTHLLRKCAGPAPALKDLTWRVKP